MVSNFQYCNSTIKHAWCFGFMMLQTDNVYVSGVWRGPVPGDVLRGWLQCLYFCVRTDWLRKDVHDGGKKQMASDTFSYWLFSDFERIVNNVVLKMFVQDAINTIPVTFYSFCINLVS